MSRKGAALFVALIAVLVGGMIVVMATMVAIGEIRAGTTWSDRAAASVLAASAVANGVEEMESAFDSLAPGESTAITASVALSCLDDSVGLLSSRALVGGAEEVVLAVVRAWQDSSGALRLLVPGSRVRFHPIP